MEGHDICNCYAFKNLTNPDKFACLRNNGVCFKCVNVGHLSKHCRLSGVVTCDVIINGKTCGMEHHKMLHYVLSRSSNTNSVTNNLVCRVGHLLMVNRVECQQKEINVLWDSGSNVSLITHRKAKELGLKGQEVYITVTKVGNNVETMLSEEYVVPIVDMDGVKWEITACGIHEITAPVDHVDMTVVPKLFPCLNNRPITRPEGGAYIY